MDVPLADLRAEHARLRPELDAAYERVLASSTFILGPEVAAFERDFAAWARVRHCVSVANGTDALELGLRALSVGAGDEVIVPAHTFIATALAVLRCGAVPKLVDVDPHYLLLDPQAAAAAVSARTRAIIPVHLYGQAAPCEELPRGSGASAILEDAAQAHGASRFGRPVGTLGRLAATSFYPGKNLGALGDGGAVITDDAALADRVRKLRNYGSEQKYHHPTIGFNSRLDEMQAAFLRVKLSLLAEGNEARRDAADRYDSQLASLEQLELPAVAPGNVSVWHLYVVRVRPGAGITRDAVVHRLREAGVHASVHYPLPVHLHGALSGLGYRHGQFPVAEDATARMLSLPLFPGVTPAQQDFVVDCLRGALGAG